MHTAEKVKAILRREIIFGQRPPGARLPEQEIAEAHGVGRHVVRSILADLERMGLVQRRPNRGAVVTDYSRDEIDQLYEMRDILQREAVARIPLPVPRSRIAALGEWNHLFRSRIAGGDLEGAVEANNGFHRALFGLCGNRFLSRSIEDHWQRAAAIHSYAIGRPEMAETSVRQHAAMIDALQAQDRDLLARLCAEHMQPALAAYQGAQRATGVTAPFEG